MIKVKLNAHVAYSAVAGIGVDVSFSLRALGCEPRAEA